MAYPILQQPTKDTYYAQDRFIPAVGTYLEKIDAKIELHKTFVSLPLRINDSTIMELFHRLQLTPRQRQQLN